MLKDGGADTKPHLLYFANSLQGMRDTMVAALPIMKQQLVSIDGNRESSEAMDIAGKSAQGAISVMIDATGNVVSFCDEQLKKLRS